MFPIFAIKARVPPVRSVGVRSFNPGASVAPSPPIKGGGAGGKG